jgi:uncharacterized membrane protein
MTGTFMNKTALKGIGKKKTEPVFHISACVYAAVIFASHFMRIFDNDFWGDEAYSIGMARIGFGEMLKITASDVHPPLYYSLLMLLYRIFGDHGWVYHLAAIVPFAVVLVFAVTSLYKRFGKEAAFIFLTLIGFSDNAVIYNVEVRMYCLAFMFVLLSYYSLYRCIKGEKRAEVFFVLFSLGAAYSHYYAMLAVAFFYLALFVRAVRKKYRFGRFFAVCIATVAGYLPWLIQVITTFGRTTGDYWMTEIPGVKDLVKYFFLSGNKWYSYAMFLCTAAVALICILKRKHDAAKAFWIFWGLAGCLGVVLTGELVSALLRPVFTFRFIYPVVSVMWLVLAAGVSELKIRGLLAPVIIVISLIVYVPSFTDTVRYERYIDEICADTAADLRSMVKEDDIILTDGSHLDWTLIDYYVPGTAHELVESVDNEYEEGRTYYLFWSEPLTQDEIKVLDEKGLTAEEKIRNGLIGNWVNVYKLTVKMT